MGHFHKQSVFYMSKNESNPCNQKFAAFIELINKMEN